MPEPIRLRPLDELGRVAIPQSVRDAAGLRPGTPITVEIACNGLLVRRDGRACVFCAGPGDVELSGVGVCLSCRDRLASGIGVTRVEPDDAGTGLPSHTAPPSTDCEPAHRLPLDLSRAPDTLAICGDHARVKAAPGQQNTRSTRTPE